MTIFLDADCVITRLIGIQFIAPVRSWKREHPATKMYHALFDHLPTKGKLCFEVHVENGRHKVSALYVNNLERIHNLDLSAIVTACTM
jgi:phosphoribosylaminoimidazole carboxylase (NCAIR synthetase)